MNFESIDPDKLDLPNESELTPEKRKELKNKLLGLIQEGYNLIKSTEEKYEEEILTKLDDLKKIHAANKTFPAPTVKVKAANKTITTPIIKQCSGVMKIQSKSSPPVSTKCFYKAPEAQKPNPSTSNNLNKTPNKLKQNEIMKISLNSKWKQLMKNTVIKMNNSPTTSSNLHKKLPIKPTTTNSNDNSSKSNPKVIKTTVIHANNSNKKLPVKLKENESDKSSTSNHQSDPQGRQVIKTTVIHNSSNLNNEVSVNGTDTALKLPTNNSHGLSNNLNKKLPVKLKENENLTTAINSKWSNLLKGKVTQAKTNLFKGNETLKVVENIKKINRPVFKLPQNDVKSSTVSKSSNNLMKNQTNPPNSTANNQINKKVKTYRYRCLTCRASCSSYEALKKHLKDGHKNIPPEPEAPPPFEEVIIKMEIHEELLDDNNLDITTSGETISNDEPFSEVISIEDNDSLDSDEMSEILSKLAE